MDLELLTLAERVNKQVKRYVGERDALLTALKDLLMVIENDALIPESVSYMRAARAAVAKAEKP